MATPKPFDSYPIYYTDLFRDAYTQGKRSIPFKFDAETRRFRAHLYAFREALLDEPHKAPDVALHISLARLAIRGATLRILYPRENQQDARPHIPESGRLDDTIDV